MRKERKISDRIYTLSEKGKNGEKQTRFMFKFMCSCSSLMGENAKVMCVLVFMYHIISEPFEHHQPPPVVARATRAITIWQNNSRNYYKILDNGRK